MTPEQSQPVHVEELPANPVISYARHQELKGPVTAREMREAWAGMSPEEVAQQHAVNAAGFASIKAAMAAKR